MTFARPPFIEEIRAEVQATTHRQRMQNSMRTQLRRNPDNDLFKIKTADKWLADDYGKPIARKLMGSLWHEHELCILFADTNLGKSVLAVQIGCGLAKQSMMEPFGCQVDEPLKVLYIDFELTTAQFRARYTHREYGLHHFGEHFIRAEFNPAGSNPILYERYDDYVQDNIESAIKSTKAQVLIIDNITCIGSQTGNSTGALPLMNKLKALKSKYKLSVLVLAYTPKRNIYQPITVNDLQGSKMLINFADSAFALGQSCTQPGLRYLKQIKQRNTANDYGASNVCLFQIKQELSFLNLEFIGYDTEHNHLQRPGTALSEETKGRIAELSQQGLSNRQVADNLKISVATVKRYK
ncbi:AAA family ATPase [Mucilaginibacter calamicampi]|uniref:AAA family ATPase n=1 Tax=Mucilaginibacter calamicampi TaxID=1302352 RepID=A0ABW2Z0W2_9SPHI